MLHHRIKPQIVKRAVGQVLFFCQLDQLLPLGHRHRQGLLAKHMLARFHRCLGHGEMQRVGCTDVHGVDFPIVQHGAIIAGRSFDPNIIAEFSGLLIA